MTISVKVKGTNVAGESTAVSLPVTITPATPAGSYIITSTSTAATGMDYLLSKDGNTWNGALTGLGAGITLTDVQWVNSQYVIVGYTTSGTAPQLYTSSDGISIVPVVFTGLPNTPDDISYDGTSYWLSGAFGIRKSADLITWSTVTGVPAGAARRLLYAGGKWVIPSNSGIMRVSTDGNNFTAYNVDATTAMRRVVYGASMYVASGFSAGVSNALAYSSDATTWTLVPGLPNAAVSGIAFGEGMFVANVQGFGFYYSSDGISWNPALGGLTISTTMSDCIYAEGRFITASASMGSLTFQSDDGITWYSVPKPSMTSSSISSMLS